MPIKTSPGGGSLDEKVKVTSADTIKDYLDNKIVVGSNKLVKTVLNPAGDEDLQLDVDETNIDHGSISGLGDDDHTQYHNDGRADTWFTGKSISDLGTKDHDLLDGLSDDDHTQYLLANGTRQLSADWNAGSHKITAKQFAGWGIIPIGTVCSWLKSYTNTPSLPDGYVECNGQSLSDSDSLYNGQTIPNLNGNGGTKRYLRGSTSSGTTGGSETHRHYFSKCSATCGAFGTTTVRSGSGATVNSTSHDHYLLVDGYTTYISNLPSYYEVVWIMRVK